MSVQTETTKEFITYQCYHVDVTTEGQMQDVQRNLSKALRLVFPFKAVV